MPIKRDINLKNSSDHVIEQLLNKDWGDLELLETGDGRLLFPAEIHKLKKGGGFETIPVMLRIPREPELRQARVQAREIAKKDGLDLDRDKDLIKNLEDICILCEACRNPKPPHETFDPYPGDFEKNYDLHSIAASGISWRSSPRWSIPDRRPSTKTRCWRSSWRSRRRETSPL